MANTVVLETVQVNYKPVWDGANWVLTPSEIEVIGRGQLTETGVQVLPATIKLIATNLPAAGQTALQELYSYIESEMASEYS